MAHLVGRLAYIRHSSSDPSGSAYVEPAGGGVATRLPGSSGASLVALSPQTGDVLMFVSNSQVPYNPYEIRSEAQQSYVLSPPYNTARRLPPPVSGLVQARALWTPDGQTAFLRGGPTALQQGYAFNNKKQELQPLPFPFDSVATVNGQTTAVALRTPGGGVYQIVRWKAGKTEVLLDNRKPAAINKAARITPREAWRFFAPTLAPETMYGRPEVQLLGQVDNAQYVLWVNLQTKEVTAYPLGNKETPTLLLASPYGPVSLYVGETNSKAWTSVVRLLLWHTGILPLPLPLLGSVNKRAIVTAGACWSPDGKYVAVSYGEFGPNRRPPSTYNTRIVDIANRKTVRTIRGAILPSWGA